MQYEILYQGTFPIVKYHLEKGERLKAESDAMIAMSSTIDVTGGVEGGIKKGLTRMLSGEKFFFQYLTATRGSGEILFAHAYPGDITDIQLDGTNGLIIQKNGFLASTEDVEIDTKVQNLTKGLFSKEGFFILKARGKGTLFLSSYGAVHNITLSQGEEIVIDNGHLVAWTENMEYKIEKASNNWANSIMSGEGLVCRFKGAGQIWIQTRNPNGFSSWVSSMGFSKG